MTDPNAPERDADPDRLADGLQQDADALEERSADLDAKISSTRQEWEGKRRDRSEAGAPPPEGAQPGE